MKRYDEYKDTGIDWLPKLPSHWEGQKMKYCFIERSEKNHPNEQILCATQSQGVIPQSLYQNRVVVVNKGFEGLKLVKEGDFVISLRSFEGGIEYAYYQGIISAAYTILSPTVKQNTNYFKLLFKSHPFIQLLQTCVTGIREGQNINYSLLGRKFIPIPPLAEQEKIVSYLESKTLCIDAYVAERERELQLLNELKESEIANVITRGLNPDVKMKDSGIPWIGMIPDHWEVVRIKAILSESKEKTDFDGGTLLSLSQYTGITLKENAKKTGMFEAESTVGYNIVHPGQFVMNIMLAWNGSYAVSDYEGVISPAYCVFNFNVDCERKYFHYLLRLPSYAGTFKTQSKGIIDSRLRLYPQYFLSFKTIVPPIEEQRAIVAYIEDKCSKVNSLIDELEAEIEYLKEYKQKLIADCVTGQINVQSEI